VSDSEGGLVMPITVTLLDDAGVIEATIAWLPAE
jgi:hypothetical protein